MEAEEIAMISCTSGVLSTIMVSIRLYPQAPISTKMLIVKQQKDSQPSLYKKKSDQKVNIELETNQ